MGEWYYIGHYGQLGPLTLGQVEELIQGGVIARDTYVWRNGMNDWLVADRVDDLKSMFAAADPYVAPPPPPTTPKLAPPAAVAPMSFAPTATTAAYPVAPRGYYPEYSVRSDRNRTLAGVLQLFLPGIGRMYLGYAAYGVLQLVLVMCGGVGIIWSFVDGIIILSGGLKLDGYGRQLGE